MENKIKNSHDKLFRDTWSNLSNAKSFLQHYLPDEILDIIKLDSLEICKDTFIENDLKDYYSDMLYRVNLGDDPCYIYFLFEHKSFPDTLIHLQLLEYMIKIWRLQLKQGNRKELSIIIPLVLFHGLNPWKTDEHFSSILTGPVELVSGYIPDFRYLLYDLSKYSDDDIKGTIMGRVVMLLFKYIFDHNLSEKLPEIFFLLKDLLEKETGLQYLES